MKNFTLGSLITTVLLFIGTSIGIAQKTPATSIPDINHSLESNPICGSILNDLIAPGPDGVQGTIDDLAWPFLPSTEQCNIWGTFIGNEWNSLGIHWCLIDGSSEFIHAGTEIGAVSSSGDCFDGGFRISFEQPVPCFSTESYGTSKTMRAYNSSGVLLGTVVATNYVQVMSIVAPNISYVEFSGSFFSIQNIDYPSIQVTDLNWANNLDCPTIGDLCAASPVVDDITLCPNDPNLKPEIIPVDPTGALASTVIASDDFDLAINLLAKSNTTQLGFQPNHIDQFTNLGDIFGTTDGDSANDAPVETVAPFALVDDNANPDCPNFFFGTDQYGAIPCDYGNNFFGIVDTKNTVNMGNVSADWIFNIGGAIGGVTMICMDIAAMGDFEVSNDAFDWSYDIDGGGFSNLLSLVVNEDIMANYDITIPISWPDPLTLNGEIVDNGFEKYCFVLGGCFPGQILTLRLEVTTDGGNEAVAFDNIEIYGSTDPDQVLFNYYDQDPSLGGIDPVHSGPSFCPGTTEQTSPETYWVTAVGCDGCESEASEVTITIDDNEDPEITCPDPIFIELAPGECETQVFYDLPTATDNCPGPILIGHQSGPLSGDILHKDDSPWTVTYRATDANGNSSMCSFQIEIVEFQDPVTSITCNDHLQITLPSTCKLVLEPDMILEGGPYGCYDDFTVSVDGVVDATITLPGSYTVQVEDENGNTCWTDIWVEDNLPPATIKCPCPPDDPCDFICLEEPWIVDRDDYTGQKGLNPLITDCLPFEQFFKDELTESTEQCGTTDVNRTWYITYTLHGEEITEVACEQVFRLVPATFQDLNRPISPVELPCGSDTSPEGIADYFDTNFNGGYDDGYAFAYPYVVGSLGEYNPLNYVVCNLGASKTDQVIYLCGEGGNQSKKVVRTWTILDWCSSDVYQFDQVIKAQDEEGPELYCPGNLEVSVDPYSCETNVYLPQPTLYDACGGGTSYYPSIEGFGEDSFGYYAGQWTFYNAQKGTYVVTYTAVDDCGNESTCTFSLTVLDNSPPIVVADQHTAVSLTRPGIGEDGTAVLMATSLDDGSYDNCTGIHFEIRRDDGQSACSNLGINGHNNNTTFNDDNHPKDHPWDTDGGEYVKFCCDDLTDVDPNTGRMFGMHKVWLRVWDDADMNDVFGTVGDNFNEAWVYVRVEDKLPQLIHCPPDITIECGEDVSPDGYAGTAVAHGTCGPITPQFYDIDTRDQCGIGDIWRIWYIESNGEEGYQGGEVSCQQHIRVEPLVYFNIDNIYWPPHYDDTEEPNLPPFECLADADPLNPTWDEQICSLVAASLETDTFKFEEDACLKILRHWTIIDWCQYDPNDPVEGIWYWTQIVKIVDDHVPQLAYCNTLELQATDYCLAMVPDEYVGNKLENSATDMGCGASPWLKWEVELDLYADYAADYIWTSDEGKVDHDVYPPVFYIPVTSNDPQAPNHVASVPSGEEPDGFQLKLPLGTHRARWYVSDGCGNVSECYYFINVVDKKPPTPYCLSSISTAVMDLTGQLTIWANDFDLGSTENCTGIRHSFSGEEIIPFKVLTCEDIPNGISELVELDIWLWDAYDNRDFCTVTLRLDDNEAQACADSAEGSADIGGRVSTEFGDGVENVSVNLLSNQPEYPIEAITSQDGAFTFPKNPLAYQYEMEARRLDNPLNGVSTLDLVLIQKHILGLSELNSPYKVLAADINNDEKVSALDLVELRKLILGIYNELPNNDSWRFVDADEVFGEQNNPWPFTEVLVIEQLNHSMMNQDFVAMKTGDVSGNARANNFMNTEIRSRGTLTFEMEDQKVRTGEEIRVAVYSNDFVEISGFQFTLEHKGMQLKTVEAGVLNIGMEHVAVHGSRTTMSWNDVDGITSGDKLFTLTFNGIENSVLSNTLDISSKITTAEAYTGSDYSQLDVALEFGGNAIPSENAYKLHQNQPNPFAETTLIGFELPENAEATITVYDVAGKVLYQTNGEYSKGYNEIKLSNEQLNATGIMYYELKSGSFTTARKMIRIE